ncbi:hypothetical protein QQF64_036177 [Cirrhinus molitorella]|uniref:Uncharacterized protein n=1 Tax=Cirrhinus molitorella TaxID=172907 RepID=A0ABR3NHW2_9TELE
MLLEMTGTEVFDKPPSLERAHRSPGQKPADGRKPRPFVVCFHRFQEKERLLRWARRHEMKYKGNPSEYIKISVQPCQGNVPLTMASSSHCTRRAYGFSCFIRLD